jgi:hypothetical protein
VTLPEVITGDLTGKFGEISLYNQHADFESGSASNSNSTSPWVTACEAGPHRQMMGRRHAGEGRGRKVGGLLELVGPEKENRAGKERLG